MVTRRAHGEGTIRQRTDGRWEARMSLPDGRRKSFYGKTRKAVQDQLREAQRKVESGIDLSKDRITVRQYLEHWLKDIEPNVRPSTHTSYSSYCRNHLIPSLGSIRLSELKAPHVNTMLREMAEKGLAPRTRNYARSILRKALNDAIDADLLSSNAAEKARPARQSTAPIEPLTPEQVQILLRHTRDHWLGPLIHTAIGTGLRQGELFGLRWDDVDLENATITVRFALQRINRVPTFVPPKTEKSRRTIALDPTTLAALKRQRIRQLEARMVAGEKWQDWNLVFTSTIGTPLDQSNVTRQFQRLLREAGLPRQRFHDLRHCAASLLLSQGAELRTIQEFLGHSQISLTANTYTHLSEKLWRDTAQRMGEALSGT